MKLYKLSVILSLFTVLVLVCCLSSPVWAVSNADQQPFDGQYRASVDQTDNQSINNLVAGEELVITLNSNHSTGFRWNIADNSNPQVLGYVSDDYILPGGLGAQGNEVWNFKALKPGTSTLSLKYWQPWSQIIIGTFEIQVNVAIEAPATSNTGLWVIIAILTGLIGMMGWRQTIQKRNP